MMNTADLTTPPPRDLPSDRLHDRKTHLLAEISRKRTQRKLFPLWSVNARRRVVVAIIVVAVVTVTAPALGLQHTITDWLRAEKAPPATELAFSTLDEGAPPGLETGVIPGTARKAFDVALPEGARATLWLAPTAKGGFCMMLELVDFQGRKRGRAGPGCDDRPNAAGYGLTIPGPISRDGLIERGPVVIYGHVNIKAATKAIIRFEDGTATELPLTRISSPIDAGFFVYGVPATNWKPAHRPTQLRYVDQDGNGVGEAYSPLILEVPSIPQTEPDK